MTPSTAEAAPGARALAGPGAKYYSYLTPLLLVQKGGSLTFTNIDLERHNVVQDVRVDGVHGSSNRAWCRRFPSSPCPVFYSRLIGLAQSVKVKGLRALKPGRVYTFYCTIHPGMKGKLVALPPD
jgi:plastocyanin